MQLATKTTVSISLAMLLMLLFAAGLQSGPQKDERPEVPQYLPTDDEDAQMHGGQPDMCLREGSPESRYFKPNCDKCTRTCTGGKRSSAEQGCRTTCRSDRACKCHPPCAS